MAREFEYADFDLMITPEEGGRHTARVINSPAGEARRTIDLREVKSDLEQLRIGGPVSEDTAKQAGALLYDAVFDEEIETAFLRSRDKAAAVGKGLRVRLRLTESPDLAAVPWEYLYREADRRWMFLSSETPIVRYLDLADPIEPLTVEAPLRVLVVISNPSGVAQLEVEDEWRRLEEATERLAGAGLVELHRLEAATHEELRRVLRRGEYHIFHFVGHGHYQPGDDDGSLLFENDDGAVHEISGQQLGALLGDHPTMRLIILNACEGGAGSDTDSFSGAAQTLVAQGIPAVTAMQFPISDAAALTFAGEFYSALADGLPVDASLSEARKAISGQTRSQVEWGTPVLFMRAENGVIFDLGDQGGLSEELRDLPHRGLDAGDWEILMKRLARGRFAPLVGWSTSVPAVPRRQEIADGWADEYGYPIGDKADLPKVAQYVSVVRDRMVPKDDVAAVVESAALDAFGDASCAYESLAKLPIPVYLTTNFDDLLSDALRIAGKEPTVEICPWRNPPTDPHLPGVVTDPTPEKPVVYHLHGHPSEPSSMVLTEDDYFDYVVSVSRNQNVLRPRILEALSGASLVMLGYRLEDWMFRVLVRGLVAASEASGRGFSVAVQIPPSENGDGEYVEQYISALFRASDDNKLRLYWGEATDFAAELATRWKAFEHDN